MKLFTSTTLLVCFTITFLQCAQAATNPVEKLSLHQALEMAQRLQPDLVEGKALIDAAAGRAEQAGAFPNPDAIARIESAPLRGSTAGDAEYLAGVAQAVPLGGRLGKGRQAEQLERERRVKELEVRRRVVRKRVHGAFATALYQEEALRCQRGIVASVEKAVAATKARVNLGDALREDLARVEMELARAGMELHRADSMRGQAMAQLIAAIGEPGLLVASLEGTLDATFQIPAMESLSASLASHPAVAMADADIRASNARVDLAKAERIPDVKVELLYRRLQSEKENAFDIGVSIPLPLFDRNQGRIRETRAEADAAKARLRATQSELSLQLGEAHAQLSAALTNGRALKAEILPRAETVLKAAEARYAAGDIGLNEVLVVRRDWAAVQLSYLESLRDVMHAWAALAPYLQSGDVSLRPSSQSKR